MAKKKVNLVVSKKTVPIKSSRGNILVDQSKSTASIPKVEVPEVVKKSKEVKEIEKILKKPERVTKKLIQDVMAVAAVKVKSNRPEIRKEGLAEIADLNERFRNQTPEPHPDWKK